MARKIAQRLAIFAVCLLGSSLLVFLITAALPGNVAQVMLGTDATPEAVARLSAELGLDRPWPVRYFEWLGHMLVGDFGTSPLSHEPVMGLIGPRLAVTGWLVGLGIVVAILISLPLGMFAAMRRRHLSGFVVNAAAQVGMAIPAFFGGIILCLVFAVWLRWLPANGYVALTDDPPGWAAHLVLPVLTLALVQSAVLIRYVRNAFIEVLHEDYLRTARAVGWTEFGALLRHGVRNASISLVTVVALQLASAIVGAIVIEQVFNLPGVGTLLLSNVSTRDLVVVQGTVMFLVLAVLLINALVDIAYVLIDPRQKSGVRG
ncbi:MAG: ABC transporter permease [Propionibacteriaceae bacterium]|jgi:peptide/nickel transport system permease protein|nr:ABC transporter permease [Propionibacteriaceae bacterium]